MPCEGEVLFSSGISTSIYLLLILLFCAIDLFVDKLYSWFEVFVSSTLKGEN